MEKKGVFRSLRATRERRVIARPDWLVAGINEA